MTPLWLHRGTHGCEEPPAPHVSMNLCGSGGCVGERTPVEVDRLTRDEAWAARQRFHDQHGRYPDTPDEEIAIYDAARAVAERRHAMRQRARG